LRGEPELSEPPWRQVKDYSQPIAGGCQMRSEVETMRRVRAAKGASLLTIQKNPSLVVQPQEVQTAVSARRQPLVRQRGLVDPMAVFHPLTRASAVGQIPVRQDTGFAERVLYGARHGCPNAPYLSGRQRSNLRRLHKPPEMGCPA